MYFIYSELYCVIGHVSVCIPDNKAVALFTYAVSVTFGFGGNMYDWFSCIYDLCVISAQQSFRSAPCMVKFS